MIIEHKHYDLFGKLLFEKAIILPPFKKPTLMSNEACFLYVIRGENNTISEVDEVKIPAKESLLLKCGNYLTRMFPSSTSKEYEAVAVHFHPDVLKKIYENDLPKFLQQTKKVSTNTNLVKINTSPLFEKYIDGVLFYFENPDLVTEELLVLKLKELILLLNQTKDAPKMQQILSELFSPAIYSFKQIIDAHIFSDLSLEDLAQLTNLSVSSFKREFKKIYQDSPASYIKNKKLEHASELLIISDIRITNIAYDCGFNDIAHFSKSFQEKYSISPSNFRLSQKNKSLD